ncbi:SCO family protein [Vibrio scophthalmi]|uniref:Cytochrome oxidase biogenesis protein Sco1/SenC/PrrC putative copper metallochaperone n=1 Tax=Vibrio scophthalmi LMG 19158 TaxID=870967 RepID=F9RJZ3_9VIBR|nr:SCO family protein [Vibrio scophthalmi]EGU40325.1 cytochrome oxidase biogenesis protein Sco1/SenC/PrrC putative copper metallochaperone [Vibrio scophthalmi LMG 19158]
MSKNWSLILVAAFALGYGVKVFIDSKPTPAVNEADSAKVIFQGENNNAVDLFDNQDDRVRIIYFGFTHCPDVCPTSLAMLAGALNQLDDTTKSNIRPIFISLDPERDDANTAHTYAQYFHPLIEGLSAPITVTQPLATKYGVVFKRTELEESELQYTLDHNSYFYFIHPDGSLITKVPHTLTPAPLVAAIKSLNQQ